MILFCVVFWSTVLLVLSQSTKKWSRIPYIGPSDDKDDARALNPNQFLSSCTNFLVSMVIRLPAYTTISAHWKEEQENVRIGQITDTRIGADGLVRNVTILIENKDYDRPVQILCILPIDEELDYWGWDRSTGTVLRTWSKGRNARWKYRSFMLNCHLVGGGRRN